MWRATEAIRWLSPDTREYAETVGVKYVGLAQACSSDEPVHGAEVFSLIREITLDTTEYLDPHFDTGGERQGHVAE